MSKQGRLSTSIHGRMAGWTGHFMTWNRNSRQCAIFSRLCVSTALISLYSQCRLQTTLSVSWRFHKRSFELLCEQNALRRLKHRFDGVWMAFDYFLMARKAESALPNSASQHSTLQNSALPNSAFWEEDLNRSLIGFGQTPRLHWEEICHRVLPKLVRVQVPPQAHGLTKRALLKPFFQTGTEITCRAIKADGQ